MTAQLASTVYVTDPETHRTVELDPGTCPEARLAALVTNPAAWVDGKLPRLPKTEQQDQDPPGGPGDASGAASQASGDRDGDQAASAAKKTAARKTAATSRSRGRNAADEGTGGE